jgi:hypothetical protein
MEAYGKNVFLQSIPNEQKIYLKEVHEIYNKNK